MIVTYKIDPGDPQPLTEEEIRELEALKDRPIEFDEDCPELTPERLKRFRRVKDMPERRKHA